MYFERKVDIIKKKGPEGPSFISNYNIDYDNPVIVTFSISFDTILIISSLV